MSTAYCCLDFKAAMFMTFFQPLPKATSDELRVIQVGFNAWEYSGCDYLWAGIVTNIASKVEDRFGKWKVRLCRFIFKLTPIKDEHQPNTPKSNAVVFMGIPCKLYALLLGAISLFFIFITLLVLLVSQHGEELAHSMKNLSIVIVATGTVATLTALLAGEFSSSF